MCSSTPDSPDGAAADGAAGAAAAGTAAGSSSSGSGSGSGKGMDQGQGAAVLGVAMVALAEELGADMAIRSLQHLLQYGEPSVRRAVPLALGLLSVSNPRVSAGQGRAVVWCGVAWCEAAMLPWHVWVLGCGTTAVQRLHLRTWQSPRRNGSMHVGYQGVSVMWGFCLHEEVSRYRCTVTLMRQRSQLNVVFGPSASSWLVSRYFFLCDGDNADGDDVTDGSDGHTQPSLARQRCGSGHGECAVLSVQQCTVILLQCSPRSINSHVLTHREVSLIIFISILQIP